MVTDPASPGASEPALSTIDGTWDEPFDLPADPELVMERTGYDCLEEATYPANSVSKKAFITSTIKPARWKHPQRRCVM